MTIPAAMIKRSLWIAYSPRTSERKKLQEKGEEDIYLMHQSESAVCARSRASAPRSVLVSATTHNLYLRYRLPMPSPPKSYGLGQSI